MPAMFHLTSSLFQFLRDDPKRRKKIFEATFAILFVGAAIHFMTEGGLEQEVQHSVDLKPQAEVTAARSPKIAAADSARAVAPKTSFSATSASEPSSNDAGTDRRVEETLTFEFKGQRDRIRKYYETAASQCAVEFCQVVTGSFNDGDSVVRANVTLRIRPDMVDRYLDGVKEQSEGLVLTNQRRSARDRTREYQDIAARRDAQRVLRDRLTKLVETYEGDDIDALLRTERELARVQGKIESMDARLRSIETVTDRSTVHLSFYNDARDSAPEHPPYVSNALKEAGHLFNSSVADVVRGTARLTPLILGLMFLGTVVLLLLRGIGALIYRRRK